MPALPTDLKTHDIDGALRVLVTGFGVSRSLDASP